MTDLGSAATKTAGSASGNLPVNGAALGTTANVPVVTNASGNLVPHASGALGTAAFTSSTAYQAPTDDLTAETALDDGDYMPFYDTSATGHRKTLWSNVKAKLKSYFDGLYVAVVSNVLSAILKANATATAGLGTLQVRNIAASTSDPTASDGNNGDIWIVYES